MTGLIEELENEKQQNVQQQPLKAESQIKLQSQKKTKRVNRTFTIHTHDRKESTERPPSSPSTQDSNDDGF